MQKPNRKLLIFYATLGLSWNEKLNGAAFCVR